MFWEKDTNLNKREYVRVEKEFKIKYGAVRTDNSLPVKYDVLNADDEFKYSGYTRNISEGGLCLEGQDLKKLLVLATKEEALLKLRILIPREDCESVDVVGRVVWNDIENVLCGIKFTQILYEDRIKIRNYIIDKHVKNYKV